MDIEIIVAELIHAGQVFSGTREEIISFLDSEGYQYVGNLFDDFFIRKDLLGTKYSIDQR